MPLSDFNTHSEKKHPSEKRVLFVAIAPQGYCFGTLFSVSAGILGQGSECSLYKLTTITFRFSFPPVEVFCHLGPSTCCCPNDQFLLFNPYIIFKNHYYSSLMATSSYHTQNKTRIVSIGPPILKPEMWADTYRD